VVLDNARYKDASQQTSFGQSLIGRLRQIPGATAVAVTSDLPATGPSMVPVRFRGQDQLSRDRLPTALDVVATSDYFQAAGIPLLRGRTFSDTDKTGAARVVVVNQEFVRRHFKDREPLGQRIRVEASGGNTEWSEIVGVAGNVKTYSDSTRDDPEVYEPFFQRPTPSFSVMIRTGSDPDSLIPALRKAVAEIDVELPLIHTMNMSSVIEFQHNGNPLFLEMLGTFAVLALILAAIGIYGLISYSVGQRTKEIAIRMALGAEMRQVRRMVLWEGMKMAAIGAPIGLTMA
jgi:putative ABC transport system permease protein